MTFHAKYGPILLKERMKSFQFSNVLSHVETQIGKKVKCLRSDNGGEYVSKPFQDFCNLKGIKRELTAPYNPPPRIENSRDHSN